MILDLTNEWNKNEDDLEIKFRLRFLNLVKAIQNQEEFLMLDLLSREEVKRS